MHVRSGRGGWRELQSIPSPIRPPNIVVKHGHLHRIIRVKARETPRPGRGEEIIELRQVELSEISRMFYERKP